MKGRRFGLAVLSVIGLVLLSTAVPAPFTVDDVHYASSVVAIRSGLWTLPSTAGLPPSRELLSFDPNGRGRIVSETPVGPTVPPLYAVLALPFAFAGWQGLVGLNVLALLVAAWIVWSLTARVSRSDLSPWIAAGAFLFGGYVLEYAQGLWPHLLSVVLVTGGVWAAELSRDGGRSVGRWTFLSGLLLGLATGVRYQNVVLVVAMGVVLVLWSSSRIRALVGHLLGASVPLLASSAINHARFGSWNPISKGEGYLSVGTGGETRSVVVDALTTLWFRVADFGARPPLGSTRDGYLQQDPGSGMFHVYGVAKKAWLQSCPWIAVSLLFCLLSSWWWIRRKDRDPRMDLAIRVGTLIGAVLAAFSLAGSQRTDGFSFNQRYFLEILPLAAIAFSLAVEDLLVKRWRAWAGGGLLGALGAGSALLFSETSAERLALIRWLPLALALAGVILYLVWRRSRSFRWGVVVSGWVAAVLVWSAWIHLGADVRASRDLRALNEQRLEELRGVLPPGPVAIFGYRGTTDAPGALMLEREIVVLDVELDGGETAPRLREALRERGDRVFLLRPLPPLLEDRVVGGHRLEYRSSVAEGLLEVVRRE